MFEFKVTPEDGEPTTITLKPYDNIPGRISRYHRGDLEAQIWASLEWGLVEPKHWPLESNNAGHLIFDFVPQREITKLFIGWQDDSKSDDDES